MAGVAAASPRAGDGTSVIGSLRGGLATVKAAWHVESFPRAVVLLYNHCLCRPIVFLESVFVPIAIRRARERKLRVWV